MQIFVDIQMTNDTGLLHGPAVCYVSLALIICDVASQLHAQALFSP
jgi:hypothetical protein